MILLGTWIGLWWLYLKSRHTKVLAMRMDLLKSTIGCASATTWAGMWHLPRKRKSAVITVTRHTSFVELMGATHKLEGRNTYRGSLCSCRGVVCCLANNVQ